MSFGRSKTLAIAATLAAGLGMSGVGVARKITSASDGERLIVATADARRRAERAAARAEARKATGTKAQARRLRQIAAGTLKVSP